MECTCVARSASGSGRGAASARRGGSTRTGAAARPPSVYAPLGEAWAAALGGAALLGALLTALTALYFLAAAALPRSPSASALAAGTSPLGHLMLLGLLLLFAGTLSFVLAPTAATCGARRFVPPLAYALVFSGMLLKVFTSWQLASVSDSVGGGGAGAAATAAALGLARPAVLIPTACALTAVQVLLYTRLRASQPTNSNDNAPVFDVSQFQPQPVKTIPGLLAMPQVMGLGPELGPPSVDDDEEEDPTQEVPGALYENMFSPGPPASIKAPPSSTGSVYAGDFEETEEDDVKGHHCEPGSNEFTAKLSNILVVDGDRLSFQGAELCSLNKNDDPVLF
ncbi:Metabotropic glutamate receptor 2 [Gryllus bimaculatus]|nr:Metabotropic glutamate receptor 2 [Gryllus bimaculatus]